MADPTRVVLETGKRTVFAVALDWPGWARRAKTAEAALDTLTVYAPRYRPVAGPGFEPGRLEVVGRVEGGSATDFGVLAGPGPLDEEPLSSMQANSFADLLQRCWVLFDRVVAGAPGQLRKGPRGGGRDRDAVVAHVCEGERGYGPKAGVRLPASTPWDERRAALQRALRAGCPGAIWPPRYVARRFAWHVLDHAWEIEDRSSGAVVTGR